tara:strand:- start:154 stop:420 length:267 start_codon:yes stop_codon:yes gene_type:complete
MATALWTALKKLGYTPYHFMEVGQPENIKEGHILCWKEALEAKVLGKGKPYEPEDFDKVLGRYSVSAMQHFCALLPPEIEGKLVLWMI